MSVNEFIIQDGITEINMATINNVEELERIVIPDSCMTIDNNAFTKCIKLKEIVVDETSASFSSVDGVLFSKDMKRIIKYPPSKQDDSYEIPDTVEEIESCAFADCVELRQIKIPESVLRINRFAFTGCTKLGCIYIHKNMESIEEDAFYGCVGLETFKVHPESRVKLVRPKGVNSGGIRGYYCGMLCSCNNLKFLFIKDESTEPVNNLKWILSDPARNRGEHLHSSGTRLSSPYYKNLKIIARKVPIQKVPSDEKEAYVRGFVGYSDEYPDKIAKGYFDYLSKTLKKWMPEFVNDTAFLKFMLQHDMIKKSKVDEVMAEVQKTGDAERVTMMMNYITEKFGFGFDKYTERLDAKAKEEEKKLHQKERYEKKKHELEKEKSNPNADLKDLWRINKLKSGCILSNYKGCAENLVIPEKYEDLIIKAIEKSKNLKNKGYDGVKTIVLPESLERIGDYAFSNCLSLEKVVVPDSTKTISNGAFLNCKELKTIVLGKGLNNIGQDAFKGCENLQSIVIPDGVTYMGDNAFYGCENLQVIVLPESLSQINGGVFGRCKSLDRIVCDNKESIRFDRKSCIVGASKAKLYVHQNTKLENCPFKTNRIVIIEKEQ